MGKDRNTLVLDVLEKTGWNHNDLAEFLGKSNSTVWRWVNLKTSLNDHKVIQKLAEKLAEFKPPGATDLVQVPARPQPTVADLWYDLRARNQTIEEQLNKKDKQIEDLSIWMGEGMRLLREIKVKLDSIGE